MIEVSCFLFVVFFCSVARINQLILPFTEICVMDMLAGFSPWDEYFIKPVTLLCIFLLVLFCFAPPLL